MGAICTRYLAPTIPICTLHWTLTYLGTSMYIGPHTCMSGYVSAYHGVGKLCILLHTILCHAVNRLYSNKDLKPHDTHVLSLKHNFLRLYNFSAAKSYVSGKVHMYHAYVNVLFIPESVPLGPIKTILSLSAFIH